MPGGRPKKPTGVKIIQGTFRRERENPDEPVYEPEIPEPPKHIHAIAKKEWRRISTQLHMRGLLTSVDMAGLAAYCQAYALWVRAEQALVKEALTVENAAGTSIQNPLVKMSGEAMDRMRKFMVEFGLTPASRPKIVSKRVKTSVADPWADFTPRKDVK